MKDAHIETHGQEPIPSFIMDEVNRLIQKYPKSRVSAFDSSARYVYFRLPDPLEGGYLPQELIGRPLADYIHPLDAKRLMLTAEDALLTGDSIDSKFRYRKKSGQYVWVRGQSHLVKDPESGASYLVSHSELMSD